jgi:mannose/fructose-specific phosphotransferase system component IIA
VTVILPSDASPPGRRWGPDQDRLHRHLLRQPALLPKGGRLLMALSGGQDSMALLGLLRDLQSLHGWHLTLWHGNHGWHSEAAVQAQALKACAMHVYPECANEVLALDVQADDTTEQSMQAAQQLWAGVPDGDVLVLTDVLGATPANVAQQWARDRKAKIVAGVNLPMLLRSVCYRHEPLEVLLQRAMTGGALGVVEISPPV